MFETPLRDLPLPDEASYFDSMQQLKRKQSERVLLSGHLAPYIATAYREDPQRYVRELKDLDSMREAATNCAETPAGAEALLRYCRELQILPSRFPIDEDNIKIAFAWMNSFTAPGGPRAPANKPVALQSARYEQSACLFNLAVVYSRLGNVEWSAGPGAPEALKRSCGLYLQAAGVLEWLAEHQVGELLLPPTCDLNQQVLRGLAQLMLGQAADCMLAKAAAEKGGPGLLARVAMAAAGHYGAARTALSDCPVVSASPDGQVLLLQAEAKQLLLTAQAEVRKAAEAQAAGRYGEELSRLQHVSSGLLSRLQTICGTAGKAGGLIAAAVAKGAANASPDLAATIASFSATVAQALARASKDNDLIYHEIVPSHASLAAIVPAAGLVRPAAFAGLEGPAMEGHAGLFEALVPLQLHRAMSAYQTAKVDQVAVLSAQLDSYRQVLVDTLSSYGLPGALEAVEQPIGLPQAVLDKARELQNQGGMSGLRAGLQTVSELSRQAAAGLGEIERLLQEESGADDRMRAVFPADSAFPWKRARSRDAGKAYWEQLEQLRGTMRTAADADGVVQSRLARFAGDLEVLCGGDPDALARLVPASHASNRLSPAGRLAVDRLKGALEEGERLRQRIVAALSELQSMADGDFPTGLLLEASGASSGVPQEKILEEVAKYGARLQPALRDLETAIPAWTAGLRVVMDDFVQATIGPAVSSGGGDRQAVLQRLDDAYRHYLLINKDLAEGIHFYSNIQEPIGQLRRMVVDFTASREMQRVDLEESLRGHKAAALRAQTEEEARQSAAAAAASLAPPPQHFASPLSPLATPPPQPYGAPFASFPGPFHSHSQAPSSTVPSAPGNYPQQRQTLPPQQQWAPGMPVNYAAGWPGYSSPSGPAGGPPAGGPYYPPVPGMEPAAKPAEPKKKGWFF